MHQAWSRTSTIGIPMSQKLFEASTLFHQLTRQFMTSSTHLNADDSELTPVGHPVYTCTPTHKALQMLQLLTVTPKKLSTVMQVYSAVKAKPSSSVIDADANIVPLSPGSPVTISSDSDEELPVVSDLVVLLMLYQLPLAAMDANSNDENKYEKVGGYQSNNISDFVVDDDPFIENISSDVGSSVPAISSVTASPLLIHTADMSGKDLGSHDELDGSTDETNELAEYTIMQLQYQDDFMKPSYKGLPHL
ncbi:hypothetical protein E4T56_gene1807 [Termitomyces sp. T112]|nr:hypothetical protein E4T56_gene1807 [Termitomyces sp. T112]